MEYRRISFSESLSLTQIPYAAHCMIWCQDIPVRMDNIIKDKLRCSFTLMQLRSDGKLGFPGGYVDEKITTEHEVLLGLNRELKEEINYDYDPVLFSDHIFTSLRSESVDKSPLICHFFAKKLDESSFTDLEVNHMKARDFPTESLSLFRLPISRSKHSNYLNFWANFLQQNFVGNAKSQLIVSLQSLNLIDLTNLSNEKFIQSTT